MIYKTIRLDYSDSVASLILNRPEMRNAFDDLMISEMNQALSEIAGKPGLRALVVTGEGTAFSAGANIEWMQRMGEADFEANYQDALKAAAMFDSLAELSIVTIAKVNGPAMGGGVGLVSACDIAISVPEAFFSFTEVKIGLSPAMISPYVIRKIGEANARELFLTGRRIDAAEGKRLGLVNFVAETGNLDQETDKLLRQILTSGPNAVSASKRLVRAIPLMDKGEYINYTAHLIATLRTSPEGREGTRAFLEKRKADWAE